MTGDCVFGDISVYLTEAALKNHRAKVDMDIVFGNAHFFIPSSWKVSTNMDAVFAGISTEGINSGDGEDKLLISGSIVFGEVMIHYV